MCQTVMVDGVECETVEELREATHHAMRLMLHDCYNVTDLGIGDCCLCPVDLRATLEAAGYTVWENEAGAFYAQPDTGLRGAT